MTKTMNRDVTTMTGKEKKVYRARQNRFHVHPNFFDVKVFGGKNMPMFYLARAMAFVADAIDGGPAAE